MSKNPIFIVGLYKCGTSWLSHTLNRLPRCRTVKEVDFIKMSFDFVEGKIKELDKLIILQNMFSKNSWCRTKPISTEEFLENLHSPENILKIIEQNSDNKIFPRQKNRILFQEFFEFGREEAKDFISKVINAENGTEICKMFIEANMNLEPDKTLFFKAADQIVVFEKLLELYPKAPKVFIVRDGRDASISALKFKQLMKKEGVPWANNDHLNYNDLLKVWNHRAMRAKYWEDKNEIYVMRYEDLKTDFQGEMKKLLDNIGIEHNDAILKYIFEATSFTKMSGGREAGEEAQSNVRKGQVGEWKEFLTEEQQQEANEIAKEGLTTYGYI